VALLILGCGQRPPVTPRPAVTLTTGQPIAAAREAVIAAGYEPRPRDELALMNPTGFYFEISGDRSVHVSEGADGTISTVGVYENWSVDQSSRVYRDLDSFVVHPAAP
jgi:hypothetical protein